MREHLGKMLAEIRRRPFRIIKSRNYDQAQHNKLLLNEDGQPAAIVHRYDRLLDGLPFSSALWRRRRLQAEHKRVGD